MDYVLVFYTVNFVTNFLKINWFSFGVPDNILYRFFKINNIDAVLQQGCNLKLHDRGLFAQCVRIICEVVKF